MFNIIIAAGVKFIILMSKGKKKKKRSKCHLSTVLKEGDEERVKHLLL